MLENTHKIRLLRYYVDTTNSALDKLARGEKFTDSVTRGDVRRTEKKTPGADVRQHNTQ
jgi:hypothetical protein